MRRLYATGHPKTTIKNTAHILFEHGAPRRIDHHFRIEIAFFGVTWCGDAPCFGQTQSRFRRLFQETCPFLPCLSISHLVFPKGQTTHGKAPMRNIPDEIRIAPKCGQTQMLGFRTKALAKWHLILQATLGAQLGKLPATMVAWDRNAFCPKLRLRKWMQKAPLQNGCWNNWLVPTKETCQYRQETERTSQRESNKFYNRGCPSRTFVANMFPLKISRCFFQICPPQSPPKVVGVADVFHRTATSEAVLSHGLEVGRDAKGAALRVMNHWGKLRWFLNENITW